MATMWELEREVQLQVLDERDNLVGKPLPYVGEYNRVPMKSRI